jgi:diguanylate cyclase (GGDEF)-like protein
MAGPGLIVLFGVGEYQMRLVRGAGRVFQRHGIPLIVFAEDASLPEASELLLHTLREHHPCGVLVTPSTRNDDHDNLARVLDSLAIPTAHVGEGRAGAPSVTSESEPALQALLAHLLDDRGVTRPALVRGVQHQNNSIEREQVFRDELKRRGIPVDEELVINGEYNYDDSYRAMSRLLQHRRDMDAVVALNDASAFGVLEALADEGLRVPGDILVTGFDNEHAAAMRSPGLTTVNQDVEGQAALAAEILVAMLQGREPPATGSVANRLVIRGSTGIGTAEQSLRTDANELLWAALGTRDKLSALSRAMFRCRTVDDVTAALYSCLERLKIKRYQLAVYEPPTAGRRPDSPDDGVRVILDGRVPAPAATLGGLMTVRAMVEQCGRGSDGPVLLMPLSGLDHDLGVIAFQPNDDAGSIVEVLRHDVSRALESVFSALERDRYTAGLEELVVQRTRKLEHLANSDGLTGIANRNSFELRLQHDWMMALATGDELALVMADVDYFKAYNDNYGHVAGDDALRVVATCLQQAARRPYDLAARYGGEEFVVLLPHSGLQAAEDIARRFQRLLAEAAVPHAGSRVAEVVTTSIGIAALRPASGQIPQTIVQVADQMLYRAKRAGRSQIVVDR